MKLVDRILALSPEARQRVRRRLNQALESKRSTCDGNSGPKRLAAYIVGRGRQPVAAEPLEAFLRARLPEYMVPRSIVFLDKMPRTPNGKVDRHALPAPKLQRTRLEARTATGNPTEQKLEELWREVLRVERVGVDDNFFQLGGHSLSALEVLSGVRRLFGVEVPIRVLFETPTIAALTQAIERARQSGRKGPIKRIPRVGNQEL